MRTCGIVRKLDSLGRIVLPIELRQSLNIKDGEMLEILVNETEIILKKVIPTCGICGEREELYSHKNGHICEGCKTEFRNHPQL